MNRIPASIRVPLANRRAGARLCAILLFSLAAPAQESPDALIRAGLEAYQSGELDKALERLERAHKLAPANRFARLYLGLMLYEKAPDSARARQLMEAVLEQFPENKDLLLRLLDSSLAAGRGAGIPALLARMKKPMEADAGWALTVVYTLVRHSRAEEARRALEALAGRHGPASGELDFLRGLIAAGAGEKGEALRCFRMADRAEFPPRDAPQMRMLAEAMMRLEEYEYAAQAFQVYLGHFPADEEAVFQLGMALCATSSFTKAHERFRSLLEKTPRRPLVNYYLGVILLELKRNDEARVCFERELEVDPGSHQAMAQSAYLSYLEGEDQACLKWLAKASALRADWPETHFVRGLYHARRGDTTNAIRSLERAVKLDPKHIRSYYQLSVACLRAGDEARAASYRAVYEKLLDAHTAKALADDGRGPPPPQ